MIPTTSNKMPILKKGRCSCDWQEWVIQRCRLKHSGVVSLLLRRLENQPSPLSFLFSLFSQRAFQSIYLSFFLSLFLAFSLSSFSILSFSFLAFVRRVTKNNSIGQTPKCVVKLLYSPFFSSVLETNAGKAKKRENLFFFGLGTCWSSNSQTAQRLRES